MAPYKENTGSMRTTRVHAKTYASGPSTTQKNGEPPLAVKQRNAQLDQNLAVIFKNTRRPSES